mmetsp:Transcript_32613/g.50745  ORF Transcript_32613/g.50745 Transcript_32613/m.50745 type:complete len:275 (-) Transcript_32613:524-1348(-)
MLNATLSTPNSKHWNVKPMYVRSKAGSFIRRQSRESSIDGFSRGMEALAGIEFDALSFTAEELIALAAQIFRTMRFFDNLPVTEDKVMSLILAVEEKMPPNVYHNWWHAVDVLQATYHFGITSGLFDDPRFKEEYKFALLVAALCHDLDHPGINAQKFLDENPGIGSLFGPESIFERHHVEMALEIIGPNGVDLLADFSPETHFELRDVIKELILITDMAKHQAFVQTLRSGLPAVSSPFADACWTIQSRKLHTQATTLNPAREKRGIRVFLLQ